MTAGILTEIDSFIRRDPARRGLISSEAFFPPLCPGHLAAAAAHLAQFGTHVAIVTGFFIPHADPPAAETDGPPGTLLLASALAASGMQVDIITDAPCIRAVRVAAAACDFPLECILEYPTGDAAWRDEFFLHGAGKSLSHLIALERVGPCHTPATLHAQPRLITVPIERFMATVAPESYGHCHNMRGNVIDAHTADIHLLFEELPTRRPDCKTIGIGDGGNEIGMGAIPWEDLSRRLSGEQAGRVPCRIATDWNIIAGTSNWGGYALAAATLLLRGQQALLQPWDREQQFRVLESLVEEGLAVDGVTGRREPTVDGIPFLTYIQPWEGIRRLIGLSDDGIPAPIST